jgi:dipeptidyl aminopeptidase/acylaminoacyl peptidase
LTTGAWHADRIVQVDTLGGAVWLTGMGREPGENPYFQHLYRVNGDGSGFMLLDSGTYNHDETLSPSKRYMVDTYSRVDYVPRSVLRDARTGHVVMPLETMDISGLEQRGWKPPTPFVVKAADGVTDIYGNMWKPFDFDSTKTYPIIAHVYPGPQTESVNTTFRGDAGEQELAQLGFIVIQIGNRGGSPLRSVAYHRYGYGNARDYALADKKAGIEELAARYPWIDINRVGIYGHSGGGFLTAAAMLEPPYNDFFKVGVSESGNHDNNIYHQNWSEWNYGLKMIVENGADSARGRTRAGRRGASSAPLYGATDTTARDSIRFDIHVPTNIELAKNLKGDLLLETGDMDNNVHPGNTIRLVDALIKANKRFDFMILPGKPHGYGDMQPYTNRMMEEYFATHLLGDHYEGAEYKHQW